ncbi:MAG: drug/metabolite transporter (DMT)-like permease [Myxococcota bacterium]
MYGVIAAAVLAISAAGVLVRGAEGADPVTLALYRSLGVAILFSPFLVRPSRADTWRLLLSGAALAAHFVVWFESLDHTTVLRSTILVTFTPAWVGVMEWVFLRRRPALRFWPGVIIGAVGTAAMVSDTGDATLYGDALAVLGGLFAAVYMVVGRSVRSRLGIGAYAGAVCAVSAACLIPVAVITHAPMWGFTPTTWMCIAGLVLGPQLIGHNGLNYALKWFPAATISALTLLEPIGATVLAMFVLGEHPTAWTVCGAAIALVGVTLAVGPLPAFKRWKRSLPPIAVDIHEDSG